MASLEFGDVVLTRFPYTDLTGWAIRPAVVVSQGEIGEDVILAAISSVIRGPHIPTDYLLATDHPGFPATGLRVASALGLHEVAVVERSLVMRRLGRLSTQLQAEVRHRLRVLFGL